MSSETALLIVDVQRALCEGEYAAHEVDPMIDRINALSEAARAAEVPVVLIQHEEAEGDMQYDTYGWDLADTLLVTGGDLRVRKTATDSFHKTPLQELLAARGITHVVVCGMQSEYCIDSTVRGALARGYEVTLVEDGHSTVDNAVLKAPQISAHHNATLAGLGSYGPRVRVKPAVDIEWGAS